VQIVSIAITTIMAEYLCIRSEMQNIPIGLQATGPMTEL
jgi:hypothetical protein